MRHGLSWLLTFALALGSTFLSLPLTAHAAELSLSASGGVAGGPLLVSGAGFAANGTVTLRWDSAGGALLASAAANASGAFAAAAVTIPADAAEGAHLLYASDGTLTITASVTVLPSPALAVSPVEGAAGGSVMVSGQHFTPDASVTVRWEGEDGAALGATTADELGAFANLSIVIPVAATAGLHHLFVTDGALEASAAFTVTVGTTLTVTPSSALPGTNLLASGAGYTPGSTVTLRWDSSDGAALAAVTASSSGAFDNLSLVIPASAAAGAHAVVAGDGTHSASAALTVLAPAASLSIAPASQIAGAAVAASGSGYAANEQVTLRWDSAAGSVLATATTDGDGAFSGASVTIPAAAAIGAHSIVAVGGASARQASAAVTVLAAAASLTLTPSSQVAGGTVTVSGAGYAPGGAVALRWESADGTVLATVTASSSGAFEGVTLMVPAGAVAGAHVVVASDGTHSASASVTVLAAAASLTVNPASQTAGATVTASGAGFAANEQVELRWDSAAGSVLATAATDGAGSFSGAAVTIPAEAAAGAHSLAAVGGASGRQASAPVTVIAATAALTVSPTSQTAGATVAASGAGFAINEQVILYWDSAVGAVLATVATDSAGAFAGTIITVSADADAGNHSVVAVGGASGRQAVAVLTVTSCTCPPGSGSGAVSGQVVSAASGQPIAGAHVKLRMRTAIPLEATPEHPTMLETTSDASGQYSFTEAPAGIYHLSVQAEGYRSAKLSNLAILSGQNAVVNVALIPVNERPIGKITGKVTDEATGQPIANGMVFFAPSGAVAPTQPGRLAGFAKVNKKGEYSLGGVQAGSYTLVAFAAHYAPVRIENVLVVAGETVTVNFTLQPQGNIHGDSDDHRGRGHGEVNGKDKHDKEKDHSGRGHDDDHDNRGQSDDHKGRGKGHD